MTELAPTQLDAETSASGLPLGTEGLTPPIDPGRRGVFLTDVIVELGFADEEQVDAADKAARETERPLERVLLENGTLDEEQLTRAVAERNGLDHVDLERFEVDMEAARMISRSMAERYSAVPIAFAPDGALVVAVEDVFDSLGVTDIGELTRSDVRRAVAASSRVQELIERLPADPPPPPASESPSDEGVDPVEEAPAMGPPATPPASAGEDGMEFEPAHEEPPPAEPQVEETPVAWEEPVVDTPPPSPPPFAPPPSLPPTDDALMEEPELPMEPEPWVEPEPEPMAVVEPEPMAEEPVTQPEPETQPETQPEPETVAELELEVPSDGELADLSAELRALREIAGRADALAVKVGSRLEGLEERAGRAESLERETAERDERIARLQRDLDAAKATSAELEDRLSGVGDAAAELNAATETLRGLQQALERTAG